MHDNLLAYIRVLTFITPILLILFGFILIEINYTQVGILDWIINLIGLVLIIFGGSLMTLELYLNLHKHEHI
jgi:hypothetical protein